MRKRTGMDDLNRMRMGLYDTLRWYLKDKLKNTDDWILKK